MKKILLAYLFLLADLALVVNLSYFSVLLPLVGMMLLAAGFRQMSDENEQFEQCALYAQGVVLFRVFLFVARQFHLLQPINGYNALEAIAILGLFFALTWRMLGIFREIEEENNLFAASRFCMIGEICLCTIALGCIWGSGNSSLGVNFILLSLLASGVFLLALYRLQVVYLRFSNI